MAMEEYREEIRVRPQETPMLCITQNGELSLNSAAVDAIGASTTHCKLYFDPEDRCIGIAKATETVPFAIRLRTYGKVTILTKKDIPRARVMSAHGFMVKYRIPYKTGTKTVMPLIVDTNHDNMLVSEPVAFASVDNVRTMIEKSRTK